MHLTRCIEKKVHSISCVTKDARNQIYKCNAHIDMHRTILLNQDANDALHIVRMRRIKLEAKNSV